MGTSWYTDCWWGGFRVGVGVALLIVSGASLIVLMANGEEARPTLTFAPVDPLACRCDRGHEWEARGSCGITFNAFGVGDWGPFCTLHLAEFLEDNFPKAWAVEDGDEE